MYLPISVCIPVLNEERNLQRCLDAVMSSFSEVVVVDSGSNDRTCQIAAQSGATVLTFTWNGKLPKKRNWALQNHSFRNKWVLFLDADELVTPEFVNELAEVIPSTRHCGFWLKYTNWFMGRPLRHGDVFCKLALFRVDAGEYETFPEDYWSHLDMEVHEHPVLTGTTGVFHSRLEHHDYRGLSHYIAKHNEYSTWEANRYQWLSAAGSAAWNQLTARQRFKYRHAGKWWLPHCYFFATYILKGGILDGWRGLYFAVLKRRYFDEVRMKIVERSLCASIDPRLPDAACIESKKFRARSGAGL